VILPPQSAEIAHFRSGFQANRNTGKPMSRPHIHSDMELAILVEGGVDWSFSGRTMAMPPGRFVLYWAARPHATIACRQSLKYSFHLPLAWFLQLPLPEDFTRRLLAGEVLIGDGDTRPQEDALAAARWFELGRSPDHEALRLLLLEIEARLGWLARAGRRLPETAAVGREAGAERSERMVGFIAEHYRETVSSEQIAAAADLHPKYAMSLFQKHLRLTMQEFVTALRLAHAQRLLVSTPLRMAEIARQSGFGSSGRFFDIFASEIGMSPSSWRRNALQRRPAAPSRPSPL